MLHIVELAVQVEEQVLLFVLRVNPAWHAVQAAGLVEEHSEQGYLHWIMHWRFDVIEYPGKQVTQIEELKHPAQYIPQLEQALETVLR